jgi:ATP synthase protein I
MNASNSDHDAQKREDRELKARLDKLSGAVNEARQQAKDVETRQENTMASGQENGRMMSLAFRMVSELIGGILAGVGLGWVLDRVFSTSPFLLIFFSLLGTAAGFYNVVKAASPPKGTGKDG